MGYGGLKRNSGGLGLEVQEWNVAQEICKTIQDF